MDGHVLVLETLVLLCHGPSSLPRVPRPSLRAAAHRQIRAVANADFADDSFSPTGDSSRPTARCVLTLPLTFKMVPANRRLTPLMGLLAVVSSKSSPLLLTRGGRRCRPIF